MKDFQLSSPEDLRRAFEEISYWDRMHKNKLLCKKQSECPSRMLQGGLSQILTYYDENLHYLCTIHRIISHDGTIVVHEHIKDCHLKGIWYKAVDDKDQIV